MMIRILSMLFLCILISGTAITQTAVNFNDYFIDYTMRIDYYHIADAETEIITLDQVYQQGIWAGSKTNLIDPFNRGRYAVKIYDEASGELIYSKGFDSYCGEYRTSGPAVEGIKRTFHETALIPYPRKNILFTLENRDEENKLHRFFSQAIDPNSINVIADDWIEGVKVYESYMSGDPNLKVDMAIIGEGYTQTDEYKFVEDLNRFTGIFLDAEPYKSMKNSFNIYGVLKYSDESGTDEPRAGRYKSTVLNTTFNSMGSERYLLTEDNKSLHDVAAHVPYDALLIMVNSTRYGGGGIFNFYLTFTSDNQWYEYVFLHEFGHSFTGLADEYYTSSTAYEEFYPTDVEPLEPNITALLDPPHVKWEKFVSPKIKIPTPWKKAEYDKMDVAYQQIREELNDKIARLKRQMAPEEEIKKLEEESEELSRKQAKKVDEFMAKSKYKGKVGAFEGAGYMSEGLYRPMVDCLMFSKGKKPFCTVCNNAVIEMIKYYTK